MIENVDDVGKVGAPKLRPTAGAPKLRPVTENVDDVGNVGAPKLRPTRETVAIPELLNSLPVIEMDDDIWYMPPKWMLLPHSKIYNVTVVYMMN